MNDACMQALGSYDGGRMLYIGLGTGMGTTFIMDGKIVPLALGYRSAGTWNLASAVALFSNG